MTARTRIEERVMAWLDEWRRKRNRRTSGGSAKMIVAITAGTMPTPKSITIGTR